MCPGLHFAMAVVELVLANLIYCFDWELPCGKLLEDIDMIEAPGLTVLKRDALILLAKAFFTIESRCTQE
ncbi:hypothetical protein EJ110_NYTH35726 [Nymphaea thermarum]|nr:hypothetical protein EJ110_NYTH35726 [Nymphaea thermarum]